MIRSIFFDYENGFRLCSNVRDNICSPGMAFDTDPSPSFEENGRALFRVAHRDKSTTDLLLVVRLSELWIWRTDSNSRQLPSYKFSFLLPRQLPLNAHSTESRRSPPSFPWIRAIVRIPRKKFISPPLYYFQGLQTLSPPFDLDHFELAFRPNVSQIEPSENVDQAHRENNPKSDRWSSSMLLCKTSGSRRRSRFVKSFLWLPSRMAVIFFENRTWKTTPWLFFAWKKPMRAKLVERAIKSISLRRRRVRFSRDPVIPPRFWQTFPLSPLRKDSTLGHGKTFVLSCSNCKTVIAYLPAAILHKIHAEKFRRKVA